jgi:hypothetical protein
MKEEKLFENEEEAAEVWERDTSEEDGEVIKLDINDSVEGLLIDKFKSVKYDTFVYKIKTKDNKVLVLLGSTVLDKLMSKRELGHEIKITRLEDQKSQSGRTYQFFETFHKKE